MDYTSLYPTTMMAFNISPETYVGVETKGMSVENMLNQQLNLDWAKDKNVAISANGAMFKRDKQRFINNCNKVYFIVNLILFDLQHRVYLSFFSLIFTFFL